MDKSQNYGTEQFGTSAVVRFAEDVPKQAENIVAAQDKVIDEWKDLVGRWCERRHRMTNAALQTSKMVSEANPEKAAVAWTQWLQGSMERLAEDFNDQVEFSLRAAKIFSDSAAQSNLPSNSNGGDARPDVHDMHAGKRRAA